MLERTVLIGIFRQRQICTAKYIIRLVADRIAWSRAEQFHWLTSSRRSRTAGRFRQMREKLNLLRTFFLAEVNVDWLIINLCGAIEVFPVAWAPTLPPAPRGNFFSSCVSVVSIRAVAISFSLSTQIKEKTSTCSKDRRYRSRVLFISAPSTAPVG